MPPNDQDGPGAVTWFTRFEWWLMDNIHPISIGCCMLIVAVLSLAWMVVTQPAYGGFCPAPPALITTPYEVTPMGPLRPSDEHQLETYLQHGGGWDEKGNWTAFAEASPPDPEPASLPQEVSTTPETTPLSPFAN